MGSGFSVNGIGEINQLLMEKLIIGGFNRKLRLNF
jgi:hypothetical protein